MAMVDIVDVMCVLFCPGRHVRRSPWSPTVSVYYAREKRRNCGALNASALRSPQAAPLQRYLSSPVTARDRRFQTTQAAMQMT